MQLGSAQLMRVIMRKNIQSCLILTIFSVVSSQNSKCMTRKASDPGAASSSNVPCILPFTYRGTTYTSCTPEGHPEQKPWCSTKVDTQGVHVEGGGNWGLCGKGCPHEIGCPGDWQRLSTGCYRFDDTKENVDMDRAQEICEEYGGYVVEINSQVESEELQKFYEANVQDKCVYEGDSFWIGVKNDTTKGENGTWVATRTGEPLSYNNWYDTEPNHVNDNEKCGAVWADSNRANDFGVKNFKWIDFDCAKSEIPFWKKYIIKSRALCERDVDPSERVPMKVEEIPIIGENGCLEGWTKLATGCYLFKRQPSTFREARHICDNAGGHVVEIDSEEEYSALEKEWETVNGKNDCKNNGASWWIGITDANEEGKWIKDYSRTPLEFSAWNEGEPDNHGGGVPGEDCVIANIGFFTGKDSFDWFDAPCDIRGFATEKGKGISFNPLCEQYPQDKHKRCEGCEENWMEVGNNKYKFIKTSDGTTWNEAEQICRDNGGHLAEIKSDEERMALKQFYEKNMKPKSNFFLSALNLITGKEDQVKYGWWIGASDEVEEGRWTWRHSGQNMTYSAWYKSSDIPNNINIFSYGGADCAAVVLKADFVEVDFLDKEEESGKWLKEMEQDEDFKWFDLSCYARDVPAFNVKMSPLCQL